MVNKNPLKKQKQKEIRRKTPLYEKYGLIHAYGKIKCNVGLKSL